MRTGVQSQALKVNSLIYNRLDETTTHTTPKVVPVNRKSSGVYTPQTKLSSLNRRKNGGLHLYEQHYLPLKECGVVTLAKAQRPFFPYNK